MKPWYLDVTNIYKATNPLLLLIDIISKLSGLPLPIVVNDTDNVATSQKWQYFRTLLNSKDKSGIQIEHVKLFDFMWSWYLAQLSLHLVFHYSPLDPCRNYPGCWPVPPEATGAVPRVVYSSAAAVMSPHVSCPSPCQNEIQEPMLLRKHWNFECFVGIWTDHDDHFASDRPCHHKDIRF